ncbi:hypothetical protein [Paenibacillus sp. 1001270B_150601_E10]|uniref:pPIWI_RE_Z domain-containing protein n=1 Tax=Paenibacillus sp. 1001270B_150601_E10 TaxID=2787079 RepID=UPI00189F0D19|nr:hypothetical protein [Paenibacillus sp. 1001270B_150601_E10]
MRQTYWELSEDIVQEFNSLQLSKHDITLLISMELLITGCLLINPKLKVNQAWSLLVGYNDPFIPDLTQMHIIIRMRILLQEYRHKKVLNRRISQYSELHRDYRIYEITEEGTAKQISPKFRTDRLKIYHRILQQHIPRKQNTKTFASAGHFSYARRIRGGDPIISRGIIPEVLMEDSPPPFPTHRLKTTRSLPLPYDGSKIGEEMDSCWNEGMMWKNRANTVILESVKGEKAELVYKGNIHIGGGLGAGKSTFMMLETFRLVKKTDAKVGFIEGSVAQVLERVNELRRLGIHAVPVIGRMNRNKHLQDYLVANKNYIQNISEWQDDRHESLSHVSEVCLIKALAEDYERNKPYPCLQLKQDSAVICPLAHKCGVYRNYSDLQHAEVWVTTASSVLKTRIPEMIDPYSRTIFEAMYDLLDVIFVDEADQVQKQFDEAFLTEYNVFGSTKDIFEKLRFDSYQLTSGEYGQYAGDPAILEWNDRLRMLEHMVWRIYAKLNDSAILRNNIRSNLVRVTGLTGTLSEKLSSSQKEQKQIFNWLMEYANDPYKDKRLSGIANELIDTESTERKLEWIKKIISKVKGQVKQGVNNQLLFAQLEFFIYLCRVEENIKYILTAFPMIQVKLGLSIDFSPLFTMQKDYAAFMKEAMPGITLGYKYDLPDGEKSGKFKLIEYTAIGRLLLKEWHQLYQASDDKCGPAVVFLSGTSHAPNSAHYDLETSSEWLLRAGRQHSRIQLYYKPILNMTSGEFYEVSGVGAYEQKSANLSGIVRQLISDVNYELRYWKQLGKPRRVLLVVNSYEDVETIRQVFSDNPAWKDRYKALGRDSKLNEDELSRSLIESFYQQSAEVLIVPLLSVGRGYNILDEEGGALFGSVHFLVRPYPKPNDLHYLVQILHAHLPQYMKKIQKRGLYYDSAINKLRQMSSGKLENMYQNPDYWSLLSDAEREMMGWYTFVPVWQMIGRLLRGGRDARVFFCDAKFNAKPRNKPEGLSMLEVWKNIMYKNRNDVLFQSLYGPFMDAIQKMDMWEGGIEDD